MTRLIYADNAATTQVSPGVLEAMLPYLKGEYGNPSSIYGLGRAARAAVEQARKQAADALGCQPGEIYFTSCGSESDNWAIKGMAEKMAAKGKKHIITTAFEHHAVLHTCRHLSEQGFDITYLPVGEEGVVSPKAVEEALRRDTGLVTIMYANNEIGTIQPIEEIGAICRAHGVYFHTDAVQAVGHVPIDVKEQNIDLLSLSGHKIHGPKGVGILYVRNGIGLPNLLDGGGQERGRRAGTENVASIVGLGVALEEACRDIPQKNQKVQAMRDQLIDKLLEIPHSRLNGSREHRLPGNVNLSFEGVEGESLLLMLDLKGIAASSGSACTSGSLDPSHVLLAIGLPHEIAHGSLRLSINEWNTPEEIQEINRVIPEVVEKLRAMSPLWERICRMEEQKTAQ